MPREYVYGPAAFGDQSEGVENEDYEFVVSIGWSPEDMGGGVQLATVRNGKEHSHEVQDGLYVDLDRQSINTLIRKLRRARDQAFGPDE